MTKKDVQKIAHLARLELTEDEVEKFTGQLSGILEYIDQLNEVNTDDVEITAQVTGLSNVFRKDEVEKCAVQAELLAQAPEVDEDEGVKVKSVF